MLIHNINTKSFINERDDIIWALNRFYYFDISAELQEYNTDIALIFSKILQVYRRYLRTCIEMCKLFYRFLSEPS